MPGPVHGLARIPAAVLLPALPGPGRRAPRQPAAPHTCPVCEGEFLAEPRLRQVYCSPTCRNEADRRRGAVRDAERARRLGESAAPIQPPGPATFRGSDTLAPAA